MAPRMVQDGVHSPDTMVTMVDGIEKKMGPWEGRYGLVDKTHPSCVRPGLNTRVQH